MGARALVRYLDIAEELVAGFEPGAASARPLPSESELCARFEASRTTVRAALKHLAGQGLITSRQGKGTFYRPPHITRGLGSLVDFHTEAEMAGRMPETRLISVRRLGAGDTPPAAFDARTIKGGIIELVRLRFLDGEPAVFQHSWLGAAMLGTFDPCEFEDRSLYRFLEAKRGIVVATIEEVLEPCSAEEEVALQLGIPPGTAVFRSHRIAREASGRVVEVSRNIIRGDLYRFSIQHRIGGEP